jgi:hypothetical protein
VEPSVDIKEELLGRATRLMQDPRVVKALSHPALMQGLVQALQVRAKVQNNLESSVQRVAKSLNLATSAEVRELRRTVRRLERELEAVRLDRGDHDAGEEPR